MLALSAYMENIPIEEDWEDYNSGRIEDLDAKYAHDVYIGKSNQEIMSKYKDNVLMRVEDLHWMPIKPFQYYIFGFCDFVITRDFGFYEDSDAASAFLDLILNKLKEQPHFIKPILDKLINDIKFVAKNQELYNADEDIYGNFIEKFQQIKELNKCA